MRGIYNPCLVTNTESFGAASPSNDGTMWVSSTTREHLLQKISLLAMLDSVRDHPKQHMLVETPDWRSSLTLGQEREIISNLTFLASRSKNSKRVVAIGIEEDHDGQGIVIRMAVNGGDKDISHTKEGLVQICRILEQVSRREQAEADDTAMLLRLVTIGDFPRIFKRLQLGSKHDIVASHIMLLYRNFHGDPISGVESRKMEELQEKSKTLVELFQRLKSSPSPQSNSAAYEITEQIITLAHKLNQSPDFTTALKASSKLDCKQRASLENTMSKLGHYFKASSELVLAARRRRYRIFHRIRVENFQTNVPEHITQPSEPGAALPLVNHLLNSPGTSKLLARFRGSKSVADTAILRRLNNSRSGIKVHAEIKLLFFYETHPENTRPRIICASKSACYLCDLFIRVHGVFQTPTTFGKFNERWILPDWLDNIPSHRHQPLRGIVAQFSAILDSEIGSALKSVARLPDPLESAVGLSAQWSNSSGASLAQYRHLSPKAGSKQAINTSGPTSSPSSSCTILVPTALVNPSRGPTGLPQYEKLIHGEHIWGRLAEKEKSFIVDIYDLYAIVSFGVSENINHIANATSWVRVELLNLAEQSQIRGERENVVSLESIREGAEEEVKVGNDLESTFFVRWKDQMISIKLSSIGPSGDISTSSSN